MTFTDLLNTLGVPMALLGATLAALTVGNRVGYRRRYGG